MTTRTQGLVLAVLAVVLIRLSLTGEYLRFVTPWMRWPLLASGLILLSMAIRPMLGRPDGSSATHEDSVAPRSAWMLLLPTLVVFAIAPPALGAFLAERRADQPAALRDPVLAPLPESEDPVSVPAGDFVWGAAQPDDPMGLAGRRVTMTGFVSRGEGDGWYLTRLEIACCAADATVVRVKVTGQAAPARDQWVKVTGTWLEGTGREPGVPPTLVSERVEEIKAPREVYS